MPIGTTKRTNSRQSTAFSYTLTPWLGVTWLLVTLLLGGCATTDNSSVGHAYHNLTARDNAYFLARLKMAEAEKEYFQNRKDDYNQVLPLYPPVDSVRTAGMRAVMDDCIKKCSNAVKWHGVSSFTDDCYVIIGKARFYQFDLANAMETFKYVNRDEYDNDAKHEALNWLMYTYVERGEYDNAFAVSDFLRRQPLDRANRRAFYFNKAYLHQRKQEYKYTAAILKQTLPLMKRGERRSRTAFILGQLYQQMGRRQDAFDHYQLALKGNPPYELSFYARLNLLQMTDLADAKNVAKAKTTFQKLLKDAKNAEYADRIYYEMGQFEITHQQYPAAINYFKKSVAASKNPAQKGYSFLALATVYYDKLRDYPTAKAYYDSTLTGLPRETAEYPAVARKQKILGEFVKYLTIVQTEDSLQRLARLDTTALSRLFDQTMAQEAAARKAADRAARKAAGGTTFDSAITNPAFANNPATDAPGGGNSVFYFYNLTAMGTAANDFARKFGTRANEDDWRRSGRQRTAELTEADAVAAATADSTRNQPASPGMTQADADRARREAFLRALPTSPDALAASNKRLEEAYFNLGKIYDLQLREPKNAIQTFDSLLVRYPQSSYRPETWYLLYLIYDQMQDARRQEYEEKLLREFPTSTFARLLGKGGGTDEMNELNNRAKDAYAQAYALYEMGSYADAQTQLDQSAASYPNSPIADKFALLRAMVMGKTQPREAYQRALNLFVETFPASPLVVRAQELLKASASFTMNTNK